MANTYLVRTPSSAGNRKTWTLSFWFKRTELADGSNSTRVFEAWDGSTGTSGLFTSTDNFILDLNQIANISIACVTGNESRVNDELGWVDIVASDNYDFTIFEMLRLLFFLNLTTTPYVLDVHARLRPNWLLILKNNRHNFLNLFELANQSFVVSKSL